MLLQQRSTCYDRAAARKTPSRRLSSKSQQYLLWILAFSLCPLVSRAAGSETDEEVRLRGNSAGEMSVSREPFGITPDGARVDRYMLKNLRGVRVTILTYGGVVQSIEMPDKNGKLGDIVLGFDRLDDYIKGGYYFGAIIGRFANRIANGRFTLNGKQYQIPVNNGPNALHGGPAGFSRKVWTAAPIDDSDWVGVELSYLSPDGEMGFPGNLYVTVRYTLNNENALVIHYSAMTDKDTVINLTNHSYFNLAGAGNGNVLDQILMINADRFTPLDKTLIPTGEVQSVNGTALDFTRPMPIGVRMRPDEAQAGNEKIVGYDFNWVLNNPGNINALAARATDPVSGRTVEMYTTEPAVQFYSGNFLNGTVKGKGGLTYQHWGAFALEAQHYPDSPNHANFPSTELKPGQKFTETTIYKFLPN
jgi:aldose 1-epimerase